MRSCFGPHTLGLLGRVFITKFLKGVNMRALGLAAVLILPAILVSATPQLQPKEQRLILGTIHTIAVVPPFFGIPATALPRGKTPAETAILQLAYKSALHRLQNDAEQRLPARIASRLGLKLIPAETTAAALSNRHLSARQLFLKGGEINGGTYPKLNLHLCASLCASLHADALVVTDFDGPQRIGGHYVFVPLQGSGYEPSHVVSRAQFNLVTANGVLALYSNETVQHPATRIGAEQFILPDWLEAQNLLIETFMDYWNGKLH
jgi:hypothetical protein